MELTKPVIASITGYCAGVVLLCGVAIDGGLNCVLVYGCGCELWFM